MVTKIPKIKTDSNGRRYIKIGKKKYILPEETGLSERELIKFIIKRFTRKRKTRKQAEKKQTKETFKDTNQSDLDRQAYFSRLNSLDEYQKMITLLKQQILKLQQQAAAPRPQAVRERKDP